MAPEKVFYQPNLFHFNTSPVPPQLSSQAQEQIDVTYLRCFMTTRDYFFIKIFPRNTLMLLEKQG